jgi:hypothetical protein
MSSSEIKQLRSYLTGNTLRLHYIVQRVMLCKISGFHCGDYEECLLVYKIQDRTSQETPKAAFFFKKLCFVYHMTRSYLKALLHKSLQLKSVLHYLSLLRHDTTLILLACLNRRCLQYILAIYAHFNSAFYISISSIIPTLQPSKSPLKYYLNSCNNFHDNGKNIEPKCQQLNCLHHKSSINIIISSKVSSS